MKAITLGARSWLGVGLFAAIVWTTAGCGSSGPETGTISGKVTLQGKPLESGVVVFVNAAQGLGGSANLDASGTYELKNLRVGEFQVAIQPPPPPAPHEMKKGPAPAAAPIPAKYRDAKTSGLRATVKAGKNTADFAVTP